MSKTKRKRYSVAFKAKAGLEALMGVKTAGQIAREYQVHPVRMTQWKGIIRDPPPELFESPQAVGWELSNGLDSEFCIRAWTSAVARGRQPLISNTDQGSQFTREAFLEAVESVGVDVMRDCRVLDWFLSCF